MIDASILIVGAGPSGLALACALGRQGVKARIIDAAPEPTNQSRALAVQARTLETLDLWGIGDELVQRGLPLHGIRIYGEGKRQVFHVRFGTLPSRYPYTLCVPQPETERVLTDKAVEMGFDIERGTRLSDIRFDSDCCIVELTNGSGEIEEASFEWVIGCDGAHSAVRELSEARFDGKDYPQRFLLADVRLDWPFAPNEAHLYAAPDGMLGCFPLPGGGYRVVANRAQGDADSAPDLDEVRELLIQRGPGDVGADELRWSSNFTIHARLVESLQSGRTFLVGDAGHIHSPALGQGMNTGIQDASNLGWKLALVAKGIAGPDLLSSYTAERWPIEKGVLARTDFTTKVMGGGLNRFYSWIRDHIGPIILSKEKVASHVSELVSELSVQYTDSAIVLQDKCEGQLKAGDRAPDAILEQDGAECRLYEAIRGPGHHLIVMGDRGADLQAADLLDGEIDYHPLRQKPLEGESFINGRGAVTAGYAWDHAYLIRPDGYIGAVSEVGELKTTLAEYARRICAAPRVMRANATLM